MRSSARKTSYIPSRLRLLSYSLYSSFSCFNGTIYQQRFYVVLSYTILANSNIVTHLLQASIITTALHMVLSNKTSLTTYITFNILYHCTKSQVSYSYNNPKHHLLTSYATLGLLTKFGFQTRFSNLAVPDSKCIKSKQSIHLCTK